MLKFRKKGGYVKNKQTNKQNLHATHVFKFISYNNECIE